jgi:putative Holliday junction resolvase
MAPQSPYIGLDVGSRRIGVAKSDASAKFAMPDQTVDARRKSDPEGHIVEIIEQSGCHTVVVGWPLTLEGSEGRAVRLVQKFLARLQKRLDELDEPPEIVEWDERLTTTAAESFLIGVDMSRQRRKEVVDQVAASHILQGYLDSLPNLDEPDPGEPDQGEPAQE